MSKRFCVLIEDDWEVLGNGLGNVAQHQYIPSLFFMKLTRRLGISMTFMVDVVQQLIYRRNEHKDYNLKLQRILWDENILLMKHYGYDVQLHLHPQWLNATLKKDYFYLSNDWNFGRYNSEDQKFLVNESIGYLEELIRPDFPEYKVIAYKGGSWGLQPSSGLLNEMDKRGIRIVMGVRKGMHLPKNGVNYLDLKEDIMPFYPDYENICELADGKRNIVVIPLQHVAPDLFVLSRLAFDMVKNKFRGNDAIRHLYNGSVPSEISHLSPLLGESKLKFGIRPYETHLKIGNQPFSYLKATFDNVIKRLSATEFARIPILIECHTKQFNTYFKDIEKFLMYITDKYGDIVDFKNLTGFLEEIDNGAVEIKQKTIV